MRACWAKSIILRRCCCCCCASSSSSDATVRSKTPFLVEMGDPPANGDSNFSMGRFAAWNVRMGDRMVDNIFFIENL